MSAIQRVFTPQLAIPLPDLARTRRQLGSFYTPRSAADYMADWIVRRDGERILEPCFGDGMFLRAVVEMANQRGLSDLHVFGAELDPIARQHALEGELIAGRDAYFGDFLEMDAINAHAVIGNPPYVRLRHLPVDQRRTAQRVSEAILQRPMDPAGSVWMPFLLRSMRSLVQGGRLAFVLPYDVTYVRYARPLWKELGRCFGTLQIQRTHERLFPELLQDVVILLADNFGGTTDTVLFQAYERVDDLIANAPRVSEYLSLEDIVQGERVFTLALLNPELRYLLTGSLSEATAPAGEFVKFGIGYVAGDKAFFHPDRKTSSRFELPERSLLPTVTSGRYLNGGGIQTSALGASAVSQLFAPDPSTLSPGELRYVRSGEASGVSKRYKCRIRDPWYVVPRLAAPDVMLGVFTERPILMVNDADYLASNSLLAGSSRGWSGNELVTRWYTSLTLLQCELEVHALGGGVMVMVPNEANRVRLPKTVRVEPAHVAGLDQLLRVGAVEAAYRFGDDAVLLDQLGLTNDHLMLVRAGVERLSHWRTSARSSKRA